MSPAERLELVKRAIGIVAERGLDARLAEDLVRLRRLIEIGEDSAVQVHSLFQGALTSWVYRSSGQETPVELVESARALRTDFDAAFQRAHSVQRGAN